MTTYTLRRITKTVFEITAQRSRVGTVRFIDGQYVGLMEGHRATGPSANAVFAALMRTANRVALCGEDDAAKARDALAARNERVAAQIDQFNSDMAGLRDGGPRILPLVKLTNRKVLI